MSYDGEDTEREWALTHCETCKRSKERHEEVCQGDWCDKDDSDE